MSDTHKNFRIKTDIGSNLQDSYITIDTNLLQDYDTFDILSVKINSVDTYKLHNANYGVVVGRVLANNGFGIPNAKLSIFIASDSKDGEMVRDLYPFSTTASKNKDGVRYNLLSDEQVADCHQIVGTFPNKRYVLDNDVVLEVFDKYYKYTTRTNNAGDYLIMGVPVGAHTLHMDLDLSDCGILSQRPRDFVYKGYTIEQFENSNMFKGGTTYSNLSQVFSQDQIVNVQPFWGDSTLGEKIGITRADINVSFKFEPTCVFIGSVISDNSSQGISKKCIPTENMGNMEEMNTGEGTIEMIRKTMGGSVEEFQVKGTQLIDGNGVWCYQIPMNLDYMMTDEYGNMVPTDEPYKGIPTRTQVRFRISMQDNEENVDNYFRPKVLVPHNPQYINGQQEKYDYEFGTYTDDESFRDLFWNNVYSVKSYIPRFQKKKTRAWNTKNFSGIKNCNFYGSNNPMPYNNIRIKLPFMFTIMCALLKVFIFIISIVNTLIGWLGYALADIGDTVIGWEDTYVLGIKLWWHPFHFLYGPATSLSMTVLKEGLCPDLENWFFAPVMKLDKGKWATDRKAPSGYKQYNLLKQTLDKVDDENADDDPTSIDRQNDEEYETETVCLTVHTDYLISCIEMNLAMEYKVINFDFYNDWINGTIYFPRFMRYISPKKTFLGITFVKAKVRGCMDNPSIFSDTRRYVQQCSMGYKSIVDDGAVMYTDVENTLTGSILTLPFKIRAANNFHKRRGLSQQILFGTKGGICHEHSTLKGQSVFYMKPCEWQTNSTKINLFATDIILLGSLNDCDSNGLPQSFRYLSSTSYVMPTNLALTNMETNGYLYTNKGTICAGNNSSNYNDIKDEVRVSVVSPNMGIAAELSAMTVTGTVSLDDDTKYGGNDLTDIIALTEAAGISWNYTGPGQGEVIESKMYYPGGHFLGLSCINSQTNVKSCINLSRICEVGSNMSQRKEDISSIDSKGNIVYTYTVPTGFISGGDVVGSDFRTMFSTMNHKRLIARKTNYSTGYKIYDFEFLKPINFNGTFKNFVGTGAPYNGKVELPKEDESFLEKLGIVKSSDRDNFDGSESANTQTKTIEDASVDYYLYRFGLSYDELKRDNTKHKGKFIYSEDGKMYLPQYENSYYFYFGLKNGATAIDEFNKQYFSECENGKLVTGEPNINLFVKEIYVCKGKADVSVSTMNMTTPFISIEYGTNSTNKVTHTALMGDKTLLNSYSFVLSGLTWGEYTVTIRDANDIEITKTISVGTDILSYDLEIHHFNNGGDIDSGENTDNPSLERGGYVSISNVNVKGLDSGVTVEITAFPPIHSETIKFENGSNDTKEMFFRRVGKTLLQAKYTCEGNPITLNMETITLDDPSSLKLKIGEHYFNNNEHTAQSEWWTKKDIVNPLWWDVRSALFKENNAGQTMSVNIQAEGGSRVVWGLAQNKDGVYTNEVFCDESSLNIKDGYTLDDSYVYWPTYKKDNEELTHFSTTVINGTRVMGSYDAYLVTDENGNVSISNTSSRMKNGYGFVFKPLPYGDLQYGVYDNGYNYDSLDGTITRGLFYPTVAYPVFNRPFKAKANFYMWEDKGIMLINNADGTQSPEVSYTEIVGRTEMVIYNGITGPSGFHGDSYISNIKAKTIEPKDNDLYGINLNRDREFVLSGYNGGSFDKCTSGDTSVGYDIFNYHNDEDDNFNALRCGINGSFPKGLICGKDDKGNLSVYNQEGDVDEYIFCVQAKDDAKKLIELDDSCNILNTKVGLIFVECEYTSRAPYNQEGVKTVAQVIMPPQKNDQGKFVIKYITYAVTIGTEDGGSRMYNTKVNIEGSYDSLYDLLTKAFKTPGYIRVATHYKVVDYKGNWKDLIENHRDRYNYSRNNETDIIYIVGVIYDKNNRDNALYKIYPNYIISQEPAPIEEISLSADTDSITTRYNGGSYPVNITGGSVGVPWKSSTKSAWIKVNPESMAGRNTTTNIIVSENMSNTERVGEVAFYMYDNDSEEDRIKIKVTQSGLEEEGSMVKINDDVEKDLLIVLEDYSETYGYVLFDKTFDETPVEVTITPPSVEVSNLSNCIVQIKMICDSYDPNTEMAVGGIATKNNIIDFNDITIHPNKEKIRLSFSIIVRRASDNEEDATVNIAISDTLYLKYKK